MCVYVCVFVCVCVCVCLFVCVFFVSEQDTFAQFRWDGCNDVQNSVFVFPIVFLPVCIWAGGDTFARGGWDGMVGCDDAQASTRSAPGPMCPRAFHICFPFLFVLLLCFFWALCIARVCHSWMICCACNGLILWKFGQKFKKKQKQVEDRHLQCLQPRSWCECF